MIWIKVTLFISTVFIVKYIFSLINSYGDKKVERMKELIHFTHFLRVYSCEMKMSIEEIYLKYNFQSSQMKTVVNEWMKSLENKKSSQDLADFIREIMHTPEEFNLHFAEIIDYYGTTYSDILDKKLSFTAGEMERVLKEFSLVHNEKKTLYNRISFLAGCLAAIIMI